MAIRSWVGASFFLTASVDWNPKEDLLVSGSYAVFRIIISPASLVCFGRELQDVRRASDTSVVNLC